MNIALINKKANNIPLETCFSPFGGILGTFLIDKFIEWEWIAGKGPGPDQYVITEKGAAIFSRWGVDLNQVGLAHQDLLG